MGWDRCRGASNTEYVILLVVIALATLLAVKRYGFEVKRMWGGSTEELSVLDQALAGGDVPPGPGIGGGAPGDSTEPEPGGSLGTEEDDDHDCASRKAALLAERDRETARLTAAIDAAVAEFRRVSTGHWVGSGSRWGRRSRRYVYDYPASVRDAAHQRVVAARQALNRFKADWAQRFRDWQRDCGD